MFELSRSLACGIAASLLTASSALAIDASTAGDAGPVTPQAVALVSAGVAAKPADDPSLPKVEFAPDGDTRRAEGSQATLDGLARDCANLGAETICKVALVGEGARKSAGAAAAIDTPMTIQVKDGEGREIETRHITIKVEMPEGVQKVSFRHVEENVSLPPATAAGYGGWSIVVGLEPGDRAVAEADADDGQIEQPAAAPRAKASKRSRAARAKAVRQARSSASRRAPQQQVAATPGQPPVPLSARPPAQPPAIVTTTVSGGAMARAAQSFTERRDASLQAQRAGAAQAQVAARRQGQAAPAQPARRQAAARPAPQPKAAAPATQPPVRTANR